MISSSRVRREIFPGQEALFVRLMFSGSGRTAMYGFVRQADVAFCLGRRPYLFGRRSCPAGCKYLPVSANGRACSLQWPARPCLIAENGVGLYRALPYRSPRHFVRKHYIPRMVFSIEIPDEAVCVY